MSEAKHPGAADAAPRNFAEFWPFYVRAHSRAGTRAFHMAATLLGWSLLAAGLAWARWWMILLAPVVPYPIVWFSHFFIEHNRPASFGNPVWSWMGDQKMIAMMLAGEMEAEVRRVGDAPDRAGD